jgi:hypothetical protein
VSAFPEILGAREGLGLRAWRVRTGSTRRGEASCDLLGAVLEVPLGADDTSRVVRAHELVHAAVSPVRPVEVPGASVRALECAEEFRVNHLLASAGFDVARLVDGSERPGGRRLAEAGEWAEAACFLLAVAGTGAEREFLAGVRAGRREWLGALRAIRRRVEEIAASWPGRLVVDTSLDESGHPRGYLATTAELARLVSAAGAARPPEDPTSLRAFARSLRPGGRRPPSGRFAEAILGELELVAGPVRPLARHRRPASSGPVLVRPGRLLTDPRRRAFTRPGRGGGGVVVVDCSGSMELRAEELGAVLAAAPGALVVAYSHRPGDLTGSPNLWVVADRGRRATTWPAGQVGNGVDGPALSFALGRRRAGEAVIWVTDGQVTDSNDHPDPALTDECARLVRRHGVRLVRRLAEVPAALGAGRPLVNGGAGAFGRVGRRLVELAAL